MQLHQLQRNKKARKGIRVGRGGKRGKTSGRGTKGQKARAGHRIRPEIRDAIKKLPKRRGYRFNPIGEKAKPINLASIEIKFSDGEQVNPKTLIKKGIINIHKGRIPKIKILGSGDFSKKVNVSGCMISKSAKEKIEKAGGAVKSEKN